MTICNLIRLIKIICIKYGSLIIFNNLSRAYKLTRENDCSSNQVNISYYMQRYTWYSSKLCNGPSCASVRNYSGKAITSATITISSAGSKNGRRERLIVSRVILFLLIHTLLKSVRAICFRIKHEQRNQQYVD